MTIEGLTYKDEVVRLTDLFTATSEIDGLKFSRCLLVGPAVVAFLDDVTLVNNNFAAPPGGLTIEVEADRALVGVLALRNAELTDCRLENVGIVGTAAFLRAFNDGTDEL